MNIPTSACHTSVSSFSFGVAMAFLLSGGFPAPEQELRKAHLLHCQKYGCSHGVCFCKHRKVGYI